MTRTVATLLMSILLVSGIGGQYSSSSSTSNVSWSSSSVSTLQTTNPGLRRVVVNVPPLFTIDPPKNIQFREKEYVEIPCVASGVPMPKYRWTINDAQHVDPSAYDGRIALQPGAGTLIFARPLARDDAFYRCFAYNVVGTAMSGKVYFRQGLLEQFPPSDPTIPRRNVVNLGSPLTLRCTPPRSLPKADVFWALLSDDGGFTPINYSDRIAIDSIGNLHFVNVEHEDSKNGSTYACFVTNKVVRRFQRGEFNKIVVEGGPIRSYPPRILWQSPTQQVALFGDVLSIKCIFSGSPTPRVTWVRTDGVLPANARLESFGQTLTFDNVQFDDAGSYECQAINDEAMDPVRSSYRLSVESAPYWIEKPVSMDVAENETATFTCRGGGIPEPTYFWYINGIPLTKLPADPRRNLIKNTIVFSNVTMKDARVIQCNVTSKHGYVLANAYLNVYSVAEPPFIMRDPDIGFKAAEGQTINLTCEVYGSPKPWVVWKKGDEQLTGGRYTLLEDSSLQIADLSVVDAGTYTCTATNQLGYVEAAWTLLVHTPGYFDRPITVSGWFYGICVCLFLITVFLVLLFVAKRFTNRSRGETESLKEEPVRQLQAEEAPQHNGVDETAEFKHPEDCPMDGKGAAYAQPANSYRFSPGASKAKYSTVPEGYFGAYIADLGRSGTSSDTFV